LNKQTIEKVVPTIENKSKQEVEKTLKTTTTTHTSTDKQREGLNMKLFTSIAGFIVLVSLVVFFNLGNTEVFAETDDVPEKQEIQENLSKVTCGSVIKLTHTASGHKLHSHNIPYGSGSGQQSVTGFPEPDDTNSLWIVRGSHNTDCLRGQSFKNKDLIRLEHLNTHKYLHSHLHKSPITKNQEVSAFGEKKSGDTGDNWQIECRNTWDRNEKIRLKHMDTALYLHASIDAKYSNPIPGQLEVSAVSQRNPNTQWAANEGVYFEVLESEQKTDKKDE